MTRLRSQADRRPGANWRLVSGGYYSDDSSKYEVHAARYAWTTR